jgi:uncharacterized protein
MLIRRNNETEIQAFEAVCERLAGFDDRLGWEYVDGWLTGLACGPVQPDIDTVAQLLCGDTFDRVFADPPDRVQALRALKARLSVLREELDPEALDADPEGLRLEPLLSVWDPAEREAAVARGMPVDLAERLVTGGLWAAGVADGLRAADQLSDSLGLPDATRQRLVLALEPGWKRSPATTDAEVGAEADPETVRLCETLDQLHALTLSPQSPFWAAHLQQFHDGVAPDRDLLIDVALLALQELRLWWLEQLPVPATRRVAPVPGRNEPCPCGSGKKYKKCHGAG